MAIQIGSLVIEMAANVTRLQRDMESARGYVDRAMADIRASASAAMRVFGALGVAVGVGVFAKLTKDAIENADAMGKAAEKAGVAVEQFSALNYAAEQSELSTESFSKALKFLNGNIVEAQNSTSDAAKLFKALGVSTTDAAGNLRATDQVLLDVAEAFTHMQDGALKSEAAVKIFGKAGVDMINMLNQGRSGISAFTAEAERMGLVISDSTAKRADEFNDNMGRLKGTLMGLANQALPAVINGLNGLASAFGIKEHSAGNPIGIMSNELVKLNVLYKSQAMAADTARAAARGGNSNAANALAGFDAAAQKTLATIKEIEKRIAGLAGGNVNVAKLQATVAGNGKDKIKENKSVENWAAAEAEALRDLLALLNDYNPNEAAALKYVADYKLLSEYLSGPELNSALDSLNQKFATQSDSVEKWASSEAESLKELQALLNDISPNESAARKYLEDYKLLAKYLTGSELESAIKLLNARFADVAPGAPDEIAQIYKDTATSIRSAFRGTFRDIFDNGLSGFKSFGQRMLGIFKDMLADMLTLAIARPIIVPVVASIGSMLGVSGSAQASVIQQLGGGAGGIGSALPMLGSIGSGFGSFGSGFAAGMQGGFGTVGTLAGTAGPMTGMGAALGAAAPIATGALAYYALADMISGGSVRRRNMTLLTGPGLGLLDRVTGGGLFGTGTRTTSSGLELNIGGGDITARAYADKERKKALFRGKQEWTDYSDADPALVADIRATVDGSRAAFTSFLEAAGEAKRDLDDWAFSARRSVKTQEDMQALLADIANDMGRDLLPELAAFQKQGETLVATASRLTEVFNVTQRVADLMGKSVSEVFGAAGIGGAGMRDSLIARFGGAQQAAGVLQSYFQAFYSDSEQYALSLKTINESMAALGLGSIPRTNAEFRALIEAQDLTTASGQAMYASLLQLSPAFAAVAKAADAMRAKIDPDNFATLFEYKRALGRAAVPGFASGGNHMGGWRVVGEAGPEIEYTAPSHIYNSTAARNLFDISPLLGAVKELRSEIVALRNDAQRSSAAMAVSAAETSKILRMWNGDGMPAARVI